MSIEAKARAEAIVTDMMLDKTSEEILSNRVAAALVRGAVEERNRCLKLIGECEDRMRRVPSMDAARQLIMALRFMVREGEEA